MIPYRTAQEIIDCRKWPWDTYPDMPEDFESKVYYNAVVQNGVALDEFGEIITDSFLLKGQRVPQYYGKQSVMRPIFLDSVTDCPDPEHIPSAYYNCSFYGNHYGHFLLEGLARFGDLMRDKQKTNMHLLQRRPCDFFFNPVTTSWLDKTPLQQYKFVTRTQSYKVDELYIQPPSLIDNLYATPHYVETAEAYGKYIHEDYDDEFDKVYFTKHKWKTSEGNTIINERELVAQLAKRGWKIFSCEELSIGRQKHIICNSKVVAGCIGTPLHNIVLGRPRDDSTFVYLHKPLDFVDVNTALIDKAKNINSYYYETQIYSAGGDHTKTVLNIAKTLEVLDYYA